MNKVIIVGIVAGVLIAGLIFSPVMSGKSRFQAHAQAGPTGKTKKVLLVASEKVVQVAPDDALHPVE